MKIISTFIISFLFFLSASAQDVTAIIKEADRLEAIPNERGAFNKFKEALKIHPDNFNTVIVNLVCCVCNTNDKALILPITQPIVGY